MTLADLAAVAAPLYRAWSLSIRFDHGGAWDEVERLHGLGRPLVLCIWHSELFALTSFGVRVKAPLVTFVSQSKDGEIIARVLERIGHVTTRGSSTRGGVKALIKAARVMRDQKRMAVLTIDGPKGPRYEPKPGAIFLAKTAGALLVPVRAFPRRMHVFQKSWDRFELPYPFTPCPVRVGEPYALKNEKLDEKGLAEEAARLRERMLALGPA